MTLIDVNALPASPWKNGGGETRTVAVSPAGAGFDDFDWRISIADVASSGEFSPFPGVERTILLLDGAGMTLDVGGRVLPLTAPFQVHSFSGDDPVHSTLVNGPTRDFNVMTRRGRVHAVVNVWEEKSRRHIIADAGVLYCARGACLVDDTVLHSGCALRIDSLNAEINFIPQTPDAVIIAVLIKLETHDE